MKAIYFSVWGTDPMYTLGAIINMALYKKFLPDYKCVFYCDKETVSSDVIFALSCERYGAIVNLMDHEDDCLGLYWRFRGFSNPFCERFIIRDTDSRPSAREVEAVREWEKSGIKFHIIRDHAQHGIPILGGTMGSMAGAVPGFEDAVSMWLSYIEPDHANPRGLYHNSDQLFFSQYVWPLVCGCNMAHDRFFNFSGTYGNDLGEPIDGNFIGKTFGISDDEREFIRNEFGINV